MLFIADLGDTPGPSGALLAFRIDGHKAKFRKNLDPNIDHPGTTGPQFHPRGIVLERRDGQAQRLPALLLLGLVVEVGRAVIDPTHARDRAGSKEELLGERRLPATGVAGEDDAAEVGGVDALHRHRGRDLTTARMDGRTGPVEGAVGPPLISVGPF